jgi:archaellum biogenesis ATPase FlaH
MSNEPNNIPQLKNAKQRRSEELRPYWLDPREDYPEPYYMLEYNGVPFSTIGGIQAISGQKKNGKSFVLTQLMAAILGNGNERTQQYLPGLTVPERTIEYLGHEPRVLYVDTEMEKLNSAKVLRRVHWLCDWDMKQPNDRFQVLWLKNMPRDDAEKAHEKRYRLIRNAIEEVNPDIVFIDGIRDLLSSINDENNGVQILSELSTLAEERHMCIWNALHQNPRGDANSEEGKMRGWIGTELGNKVSDTFISIKSKTQNGVSFTVKQQDARGKDIDDWKFEVTDDAGNLGVPRITTYGTNLPSKSKEQEGDSQDEIISWLNQAQDLYEWPMSRKDVKKKVFGDIGGQKNDGKQQIDLTIALNMKWLKESTMKSGGYYMLELADVLPF